MTNDMCEFFHEIPKPVLKRNDHWDSRKIYAAGQESITAETNDYSIPEISQNEVNETASKFYFPHLSQSGKRKKNKSDFTQNKILHIRNSIIELKKDVQNKSYSKNSLEIRKNEILNGLQSIKCRKSKFKKELRNLQAELINLNVEKRKYSPMCCF